MLFGFSASSWRGIGAGDARVATTPRRLGPALPPLGIILLALAFSGCIAAPLQRNLAADYTSQLTDFNGMLERVRNTAQTPMTWDAARRQMERHNISLRQSGKQLEEAEKQTRHQWLTLVPRLAAFLSVGTNISSLTNLSSNDINARLIANFNIPNPFEFYGSLYAAALQVQNARWSHELDKRRAYAQLYSLFVDSRALQESEVALQRQRLTLVNADLSNIDKILTKLPAMTRDMEHRRRYHRSGVNQMLNTPGDNYDLSGTLPVVSYRHRYRQLKIGENFGKLAMNLYAIQIEVAMMRLRQVKFQQWPSINFGFSNPPLLSSLPTSFSSDQLALFSGASKSIDLTDIWNRDSIIDAKTRLQFTREQLKQQIEMEASRMLNMSASYDQLLQEEQRLQRDRQRLSSPDTSDPEMVLKDLATRAQLELQLIENRRQIQQLDLQLLIWDERFWKS